jgi:subtilisin family serine protease
MKNSTIVAYVLWITAIFAAVALLAIRANESTETSPRRRLGETATYIVTFADRDVAPWDRCYALAEARGGTVGAVYDEVNACSLTLPRAEVGSQTQDEIADVSDPSVFIFEEDQVVYAWDGEEGSNIHSSSVRRFIQQASVSTSVWGLDRINQCSTSSDNIATPQDASNVVVFIIDTGILGTHNEFTGIIGSGCHYSAVGADPLKDGNGHG